MITKAKVCIFLKKKGINAKTEIEGQSIISLIAEFADTEIERLTNPKSKLKGIESFAELEKMLLIACGGDDKLFRMCKMNTNQRDIVDIRKMFTYLVRKHYGKRFSQTVMGKAVNVEYSTVIHYEKVLKWKPNQFLKDRADELHKKYYLNKLNESIAKAKPNMDKIKDVDEHINELKSI